MSETAGGCVYDGVPLDGVRVRIADGAAQSATSDRGRIALGGPTVAKGYRNPVDPDPFAEAGWFRTDDIGAVDDSGRADACSAGVDDAISSGGLTVMPRLVEAALATHARSPSVRCSGCADERLGQRVAAAVVLVPDRDAPTPAELREHVAASLDVTAAPREVHIVNELPRRGIGKIDRRTLAARYSGEDRR